MSCKCCKNSKCCDDCSGGHSFEPRYDEFKGHSESAIAEAGKWRNSDDARNFIEGVNIQTKKTYVCDICITCGKRAAWPR